MRLRYTLILTVIGIIIVGGFAYVAWSSAKPKTSLSSPVPAGTGIPAPTSTVADVINLVPDINLDGNIDQLDRSIFMNYYGKYNAADPVNVRCDFNLDKTVNMADFGILAARYKVRYDLNGDNLTNQKDLDVFTTLRGNLAETAVIPGNPVSVLADFNTDKKINQADYTILSEQVDLATPIWQNPATIHVTTEPPSPIIISPPVRVYADSACTIEILPGKMPYYFGTMHRSDSVKFDLWVKNTGETARTTTFSVTGDITNLGTSVFDPLSVTLAPGSVQHFTWTYTVSSTAPFDNTTGTLALNAG